jgi:hypothetical protein
MCQGRFLKASSPHREHDNPKGRTDSRRIRPNEHGSHTSMIDGKMSPFLAERHQSSWIEVKSCWYSQNEGHEQLFDLHL